MADLSPRHWFLPETPDVLGLLREQLTVTLEGLEAFSSWAGGGSVSRADLLAIEARGDTAKRELLDALRDAFVTPLEPEDLFTLSRGIDWILNAASDLVGEAEVLEAGPDAALAEMAALLLAAGRGNR